MAKSRMLRLEDVRSIVNLVGECRDLGDDWHAWQGHLLGRLLSLTDSELAIGGEVAGVPGPRLTELSPPYFRSLSGFDVDLARVTEAIQSFTMVPGASRFVNDYLARWIEEDGVALTNRDLYTDRQWRRSVDMLTFGEVCGIDASLLCCREIVTGEVLDVTLLRAMKRRVHSARDCTLVGVLVAAIMPMLGGPLARFSEPTAAGLSPRARQVLACFLEGDGDKQVAARLGISVHTANQYAKRIFRHFGVRSRTELLARWVRRGWRG